MANNRIPRNAKKIYITWKVDTTGNKAGDRATVEKTERGWIETTESGKQYLLPIATIRNGEAVQIDQIETDATTDVLLINAGVQVYIIDGSRRTDAAALATIEAMKNAGRIEADTAERAAGDPCTIAKLKRVMTPCKMETRETTTGARWTFSTASGVVLDIPANDTGYIRADKHGNLYPVDAPTEPETSEAGQDTACTDTEPQRATETAQKTTEGKTTDMATFCAAFRAAYTDLYDHCGEPESENKERYYCYLFDANMDELQPILAAFAAYRGDLVTSDREKRRIYDRAGDRRNAPERPTRHGKYDRRPNTHRRHENAIQRHRRSDHGREDDHRREHSERERDHHGRREP